MFSETLEEHVKQLETVLKQLKAAHLKLKPAKCCFICQEVEHLGHVLIEFKCDTRMSHPRGIIIRMKSVAGMLMLCQTILQTLKQPPDYVPVRNIHFELRYRPGMGI